MGTGLDGDRSRSVLATARSGSRPAPAWSRGGVIELLPPEGERPDPACFHQLPPPIRLSHSDPGFPARAAAIPQAPAGLWLRSCLAPGAVADLWERASVAIVGARAASAAGCGMARMLAWDAARAGIVVVSGLARGIDAAAHEGALLAGGDSTAVLACGLQRCYPIEHAGLAADLAMRGALVSEWGGRESPLAWRFPRRNRVISALADVVVLVEGTLRSGARHTVHFALEQGREVICVPRDPVLPGAELPNRLLRDGAAPLSCAQDLLQAVRDASAARRKQGRRAAERYGAGRSEEPEGARPAALRSGATPASRRSGLEGRILGHLGRQGRLGLDGLSHALPEIATARLLSMLTGLEVAGRVRRDAKGRYLPVIGTP
ncbi:MAG: DNA-protecting protein DprA [Candidatus Eisenbacteria bacterium]|nr:DNA-protecting protein DprA [Candidatus Eisenbacteria bacterium]